MREGGRERERQREGASEQAYGGSVVGKEVDEETFREEPLSFARGGEFIGFPP